MEIEHNGSDCKNDDNGESMTTSDDNEAISCPLFMDGLPSDFSTNPALAAIASLMNDDATTTADDDENDTKLTTAKKPSMEKIVFKRNEKTKYKPYMKSNRTTKTLAEEDVHETNINPQQIDQTSGMSDCIDIKKTSTNTTIGEASLFLKMWKL